MRSNVKGRDSTRTGLATGPAPANNKEVGTGPGPGGGAAIVGPRLRAGALLHAPAPPDGRRWFALDGMPSARSYFVGKSHTQRQEQINKARVRAVEKRNRNPTMRCVVYDSV